MEIARDFFGIEIARSNTGTFLNQRKNVQDILFDAGLTGAKPTKFSLPNGLKLSIEKGNMLANPEPYKMVIGRLLYLTLTTHKTRYLLRCPIFESVLAITN